MKGFRKCEMANSCWAIAFGWIVMMVQIIAGQSTEALVSMVNQSAEVLNNQPYQSNRPADDHVTEKNELTGSTWFSVGLLLAVVLIPVLLGILFYVIYTRLRVKHQQFERSGISYFVNGNEKAMDPEKNIMEQADKLRYDKRYDFPMKNLQLGIKLGEGAFGEVFMGEALDLVAGECCTRVAVKRAKTPPRDEDIKALITELKLMIYIGQHVNVLHILGVVRENILKRQLLVMTQLCEFGNLWEFLRRNARNYVNQIDQTGHINPLIQQNVEQMDDQHIEENEAIETTTTIDLVSWSFQVSQGMHYLATRRVLHGDLAARNVLLGSNRVVKICDFGLSRQLQPEQDYKRLSSDALPYKWMALESLGSKTFNTSTDVWSFGVFMWELFSLGKIPYADIATDDLWRQLNNGYRLAQPSYTTQDIYDIMLACWRFSPPTRPSFAQLGHMLSQHLPAAIMQMVLDPRGNYLEPYTDLHEKPIVTKVAAAPRTQAPRVPAKFIIDDGRRRPPYVHTGVPTAARCVSNQSYV